MECIVFFGNIEPTIPKPLVPYIRAISMFIRWNTIKVKNVIFADSNDYSLCVLGQAIFSRIVSHLVWRSLALDTWPQFSTCSCNSPYVKLLNKQFYWTKKGDLHQVDHPKMGPRCYQFVCKAHFFVTMEWQKINESIIMINCRQFSFAIWLFLDVQIDSRPLILPSWILTNLSYDWILKKWDDTFILLS